MSLKEIIAENVQRMRQEKGLSQKELSDISGITQSRVSLIENGSLDISVKSLERLATALKVQPYLLIKPPGEQASVAELLEAVEGLSPELQQMVKQVIDLAKNSGKKRKNRN